MKDKTGCHSRGYRPVKRKDKIESLSGGDRPVKVYEINKVAGFEDFPSHTTDTDDQPKKSHIKSDKDNNVYLPRDKIEIYVYRRRWYILAVYSLFAFTQALVWNTWGPISTTSEEAFGWSDANVAWLTNWGPVSFVLVGFLFPWLLQVKGVRWAVVPSAFLVALGTGCRVITSETEAATILIHIGQFLNGLAGPVAMSGISSVSSSWFPPHERVTATAIGVSIATFGTALAFVVDQTHSLLLIVLASLLRFSASWAILIRVARFLKRHFIHLATVFGISTGVNNCWGTVLNVNLNPYGVSENKSGWLGFYATVASCVCFLLVGRFGDLFANRMKICILVFFILGCACYTVFTLMLIDIIAFSDAVLYSTVIGGNTLINGAIPMIYELGCELAYPTSEGAANGLLTLLNNIGGLLFLAVFSFPKIGTMWTNWTAIGSIVVCIPLIVILKERFNRLEVDEGMNSELYVDQELEVSTDQESKH